MNINLRNITNYFMDVKLLSLSSWRRANEIFPRDRGGPYVVTQEGYDPDDMALHPDEFILGRSGRWLSLGYFYRMPIPERRAEFVFGTAAEIVQVMEHLPSKVKIYRPDPKDEELGEELEHDELAVAIRAAKDRMTAGATH